jgi:hypothetical protein
MDSMTEEMAGPEIEVRHLKVSEVDDRLPAPFRFDPETGRILICRLTVAPLHGRRWGRLWTWLFGQSGQRERA